MHVRVILLTIFAEDCDVAQVDVGRRPEMKRFLLLMTAAAFAGSIAAANPLCVNDANLASYITNNATYANACQIGDKLFWGFTLTPGPTSIGAEPTAASIQVQTVPGDSLTNIGIVFNTGGWITSDQIPIDSIIDYNVATVSGDPLIKDATLAITGQLTGTGGSGQVVETLNPVVAGSPITTNLPTPLVVNIDFSSTKQSSLSVTDEIKLLGGTGFSDVAHVSAIENDFSEAVALPEPLTVVLIGCGLLALGTARRKRANR
jgi:hypothetical protein